MQRNAVDDNLWGAKAIAHFIGLSVDAVYDLASGGHAPIYKPNGRYYSTRTELSGWLRTKPTCKTHD
jgi:hypothetical protein